MVGEEGFEPPVSPPEGDALPLGDSPKRDFTFERCYFNTYRL